MSTPVELVPQVRPRGHSTWDHVMILTIFAITGTSAMRIVRPLLALVDPTASLWAGPWSFRLLYIVVMTPIYSLLLLTISSLFGRRDYFYQRVITGMWRWLLPIPKRQVLNAYKPTAEATSASSVALAADLATMSRQLLAKFGDESGKHFDYTRLRASDEYRAFKQLAANLGEIKLGQLTELQRAAFLINVYNALTIHGVLELPRPRSMLARVSFFQSAAYYIGPHEYTLDDIEHGLLRANRCAPFWRTWNMRQFRYNDPRHVFSLKIDPRIHFALVCGAAGCPRLSSYAAEELPNQLEIAAKAFCNSEVIIEEEGKKIELSQIFEWYLEDFAPSAPSAHALLPVIRPWLNEEKQKRMDKLIALPPEEVRVVFRPYRWELND